MTTLDPAEFIHQQTYGVLSSHSLSVPGYPFGSITPYIVTKQGDMAIYISHLAEHTKNIQANPKVSLTIYQPEDKKNPGSSPRITCLANAQTVNSGTDELRQHYLQRFPDAEIIMELPGFQFYLLKIKKVRLIAGFGTARWLSPEQLAL